MDRLWSREEILKMIQNYGTTCDKVEELINEKIKDISEKINLIWTNENPYDEFSKTEMNFIDLNKYKKIIVFYIDDDTSDTYKSEIIYLSNGESTLRLVQGQLIKYDTDTNSKLYRNILIENNIINQKITIDNCINNDFNTSSSETSNTYLIPTYICGVI